MSILLTGDLLENSGANHLVLNIGLFSHSSNAKSYKKNRIKQSLCYPATVAEDSLH